MSDLAVQVIDASLDASTLDVGEFADRCLRLPSVRALLDGRRPLLRIELRRGEAHPRRVTGRAWWEGGRIVLTIGVGPIERECVEELILHEVIHVAVGVSGGNRQYHGPRFRVALLQAAFDLWPHIRGKVCNEGRCYAMDERVWHAARLGSG